MPLMQKITDADIKALIQACCDDGLSFAGTVREIRELMGWGLREAIHYTNIQISKLAAEGYPGAKKILDDHFGE